MELLNRIVELNEKIENLMTKKAKSDGHKEMLEKRLTDSLDQYNEKYGVNLSSKSFNKLKKLVHKEAEEVQASVTEEFELASKVVEAIESGDIATARNLLGVVEEVEEDEEEEEVKVVEEPKKVVKAKGISEAIGDLEDDNDTKVPSGYNFDDDFVEDEEEIVLPKAKTSTNTGKTEKKGAVSVGAFSFDDDDDDDNDSDDDGDDFGFGGMLSGSKFKA